MKQKVRNYTAVFQEEKAGGYSVWVPDLPGCTSQGETFEESVRNIREAITLYLKDQDQTEMKSDDFKQQFIVPIKIYA